MAGCSNRCDPSHAWCLSVQVDPPRHTRPWRSRNFPSRLRARVRSSTMSPLVRQRSRTASSWTVGMRTQTSSPARCNRASRRQSRRSVSGLVARRLGDQRRGDHLAAHVQAVQQPGQLEAGRSGLVAGSQAAGLPRRPTSLRMDASSWGIRSTSGTCWSAGKIPTEMVSLWTSRPRWIGVRCETLGTAGSFRMVAPPTPVWVTHADADRSRPFHAGYGSGGWRFEPLAVRTVPVLMGRMLGRWLRGLVTFTWWTTRVRADQTSDAMDVSSFAVGLPDGRALEGSVSGPEQATPLVFHHGTPSDRIQYPPFAQAAAVRGLRLVSYSRPGYGGSSRQPGRVIADCAADTLAIVEHLGVGRFYTAGWSGGGPHALACAALLPDRVLGCATIAGVGPFGAAGLDFLEGMGRENREEFGAALAGPSELQAYLEHQAEAFAGVTG